MSNSNKLFVYLIGLIFLTAGLGVALEILSIPFSSVLILLIGVFFWCMYLKFSIRALKYLTCFFVPLGLGYFLIVVFNLEGIANFLSIYLSLICSFLCVYFITQKRVYMYISLIIAMFVLHTITYSYEALKTLIIGYDCLYAGLLLTLLFIFEHNTLRYIPILIAVIAYFCGVLNMLNVFNVITPTIYKMILSLILLIVGGGIILYNYIKSKNDNKENRCE